MAPPYPDTLAASRRVLRVLIPLNLLAGVLILALLSASLFAPAFVMRALGARPAGNLALELGMRLIMIIGVCSVPLAHVVLTRLLAIVDSVGLGDPFVADNAARLRAIAWAVFAMELLHLAVGVTAAAVSQPSAPLDIHWSLSLTRWLAILLLFVLARVFDEGARMRQDLEGTV